MRKNKKRAIAGLLLGLMLVTVLSTGAAANAAYEHAFTIEPGGAESWNMKGPAYRGTGETANPWKVRLEITTEGGDLTTRFLLRRYSDGVQVSDSIDVKHATGYQTRIPYASANNQMVILVARDNTSINSSYWIAGQWAPTNW